MDFKEMTLLQLKAYAKEKGIRGISTLKKEQLVEKLMKSEKNIEKNIQKKVKKKTEKKKKQRKKQGIQKKKNQRQKVKRMTYPA